MGQQSLDTVVGFRPVAVIFDMDGVLADTEPRNEQALATVLARRGARMTEDEYQGLLGQSNATSWACEYVREVLPLLSTVPPSPGVDALVGDLRAAGIRLAVASSSPRPAVEVALGSMGLASSFDVIVSGEEVTAGKPAPDIFRLAAKRLDVAPSRCLVIEDSPHGLEAARRAGMRTIALRTRYASGQALWADVVIGSLEELVASEWRGR